MESFEPAREMMLQMLRTRLSFRQALQRLLKSNEIEITFEMLQIMSNLWQEQGLTQQTLAERCAKDKACMTNLLGNLEKRGWIIRKSDLSDKRNRLVYLTTEGEKLNAMIRPLVDDIYSQMMVQMNPEEIHSLTDQLSRLNEIFSLL